MSSPARASRRPATPDAQRGSVLLIALVLSLGVAVALGSYLQLGRNTLEISNRALYSNVATNLAEAGLEHGLWALNNSLPSPWTVSGSSADALLEGFTYAGNVTGKVRVHIQDRTSNNPVIYARSSIQPYRGKPIEKWIGVELTRVATISDSSVPVPMRGFVAPKIKMNGAPGTLDSYTREPYASNRAANVTVTTLALEADSADVGNSKVYGFIAVGTPDRSGLNDKKQSVISGNLNAPAGTRDMSRVSYDAKMNLPEPQAPDVSDKPVLDVSQTVSSGTYQITQIQLSGHQTLQIAENADVTIVLTDTSVSGTALSVTGNARINIPETSSLKIYTQSGVNLAGNSVSNGSYPGNFVLYGTRAKDANPSQSMSLGGNGQLSAVVYAPGADITVNGGGANGHFKGAIVGETITFNGGVTASWYEGLDSLEVTTSSSTGGSLLRVAKWTEYSTAEEQLAYAEKLAFN